MIENPQNIMKSKIFLSIQPKFNTKHPGESIYFYTNFCLNSTFAWNRALRLFLIEIL